MADSELVLHVWPAGWDLPSINAECLATILYAQLVIPGEFIVEECTDPDLSPNGQLPYITHGLSCISTYPSIIKYISGFHQRAEPHEDENEEAKTASEQNHNTSDLSAFLGSVEKAQQTAWLAYASANLGDLVACNLYTLRHNYFEFTRPFFSSILSVPQRYYVPDRLRSQYRPRLEAAGLWNAHTEEAEQEKRDHELRRTVAGTAAGVAATVRGNTEVKEAFGREIVLERARTSLDILQNLLGDKPYFFGDRPASLDVYVASHVLLLTMPPAPNDLLRNLLSTSYPKLHSHARRLLALTISDSHIQSSPDISPESSAYASAFDLTRTQTRVPPLQVRRAPRATPSAMIRNVLPYGQIQIGHLNWGRNRKKEAAERSEEDVKFDRMRWGWIGLSVLGVVGWAWAVGLRIRFRPAVATDEEDEVEEIDADELESVEEVVESNE